MTIDIGIIAQWAGALLTIGGLVVAFWKFIKKHIISKIDDNSKTTNAIREELRDIKQTVSDINAEQCIIVKGLIASLDGLHQQGCNGPVSDALVELREHINERAHQ